MAERGGAELYWGHWVWLELVWAGREKEKGPDRAASGVLPAAVGTIVDSQELAETLVNRPHEDPVCIRYMPHVDPHSATPHDPVQDKRCCKWKDGDINKEVYFSAPMRCFQAKLIHEYLGIVRR